MIKIFARCSQLALRDSLPARAPPHRQEGNNVFKTFCRITLSWFKDYRTSQHRWSVAFFLACITCVIFSRISIKWRQARGEWGAPDMRDGKGAKQLTSLVRMSAGISRSLRTCLRSSQMKNTKTWRLVCRLSFFGLYCQKKFAKVK